MALLRDLKLFSRFLTLVGVVVIGFVTYGYWSFKTLEQLKVHGPVYTRIVQGKDLVADILPPPEYIIESYLVCRELLDADAEQRQLLISRVQALKRDYDTRHQYWLQQDLESSLHQQFLEQAHQPAEVFYQLAFNQYLPALQRDDRVTALSVMGEMKAAYERHRYAIDRVVEMANQRVADDETLAIDSVRRSTLMMMGVLGLTILLTVVAAMIISKSIAEPLLAMRNVMLEIKRTHDFTRRLQLNSQDEVGEAAAAFDTLISGLQGTLSQLAGHADEVSRAVNTLSHSAQQVALGSKQQSAAANSIAAAVEQMNVSIGRVSGNAREAYDTSRHSGELSNQGGDIIHNAATTMMQITETVQQTSRNLEALGQQSQQISSVVQVIKDVADQTNLLALNAAIEAARAGEQGRGFAVVADEVRNLAKRTTKATEEISHMIEAIQSSTELALNAMSAAVRKADGGADIAHKAGEAINQIRLGSSKVVSVVNSISAALNEQNSASGDIALHVDQVAQMAENNNLTAEQTAKSALQLEDLATAMRSLIGQFRL